MTRYAKSVSKSRLLLNTILVYFNAIGIILHTSFFPCSEGFSLASGQISRFGNKTQKKAEDRQGKTGFLDNLALNHILDENDFPEDKTFFGQDANGAPIVIGNWFQYGSYTLATAMFGTGFLIACAATAVYYVLFVVTEPSQLRSLSRSLSSFDEHEWNLSRVVKALALAYETYENRIGSG